MYAGWPFFRSTLDLIEMVLAKADGRIAAHYETVLAPAELSSARRRPATAPAVPLQRAVLRVAGRRELLDDNPVLRRSIDVRNPYVDPINLVQVELLRRLRGAAGDERLRHALSGHRERRRSRYAEYRLGIARVLSVAMMLESSTGGCP